MSASQSAGWQVLETALNEARNNERKYKMLYESSKQRADQIQATLDVVRINATGKGRLA